MFGYGFKPFLVSWADFSTKFNDGELERALGDGVIEFRSNLRSPFEALNVFSVA